MDPFAQAAEDMAQSAFGRSGVYQREGEVPFPVRLLLAGQEVAIVGRSGTRPGRKVRSVSYTVTAAQLMGEPRAGDLVGIGSEHGWRVVGFDLDAEGVSYTLSLERQE